VEREDRVNTLSNLDVAVILRDVCRTGRAPFGETGDMLKGAGFIVITAGITYVTDRGLNFLRQIYPYGFSGSAGISI
jgi:hypothetical protein